MTEDLNDEVEQYLRQLTDAERPEARTAIYDAIVEKHVSLLGEVMIAMIEYQAAMIDHLTGELAERGSRQRSRLTKTHIRDRYAISSPTVNRWISEGKLPQPHYLYGKAYWWADEIEEHDKGITETSAGVKVEFPREGKRLDLKDIKVDDQEAKDAAGAEFLAGVKEFYENGKEIDPNA